MLATDTSLPLPVSDKINKNYAGIGTVAATTITMTSNEEEDPDTSIKTAVRDAARKTQDRLAAYQERQAAKTAAAALAAREKASAAPTKEKLQVESTVTRLQALVSESKRLTSKSKELNAAPPPVFAVAAPTADEILSSSSKLDGTGTAAGAVATAPKGRKLSEIMQQLHPSSTSSPGVDSGLTLNKFGSSSQKAAIEAAQRQQEEQRRVLASLSVADVDEVKFDDDDSRNSHKSLGARGDSGDNDSHSSGELSILSLVEDTKKKKELKVNGVQVDQEDAEEMMEDYYNSSQASLASELGSSLPCLDPMGEDGGKSSKAKSKKKRKSSKKKDSATSKSKAPPATEDELPCLEDITETPKQIKAKLYIPDIDLGEDDDDDDLLGASMPALDPFDTPKGFKPKMVHPSPLIQEKETSRAGKWNKKLLAINKNLESKATDNTADVKAAENSDQQKSPMRIEEDSMNLSQVFQQSLGLTDTSPKKGKQVRRPSLENVEEGSNEMDTSNDKSTTSRRSSSRRKSRSGNRGGDDDASVRSSRSTRSMSRSRRSSKNKKNLPPKRKKSFKDGEDDDDEGESIGSSKPTEVEKGKGRHPAKPGMDVSELSADASSSMQDASSGLRDGSDLSTSSRSARRGRSSLPSNLIVDDGDGSRSRASRSHSDRRGVSRSASTRSQSRSASVRRRRAAALPRPNKTDSMEDGSMRDASLRSSSFRDSSRRRAKDNNSSLRGGSFRDGGRQRRSISTRRNANRRPQRGTGDEEDLSQASTADDVLNSLDVSEIEIVGGVEPDQENEMIDDSRTSIYDKKEKRVSVKAPPNTSLAGLSQLRSDSGDADKDPEDSESVQSGVTKKSRMSKFAMSVGRKLTGKKGKTKKDSDTAAEMATAHDEDDASGDDEEEMKELAVDNELAALAAEYDAEEEELESGVPPQATTFEASTSGNDVAEASEDGVNENDLSKAKKGRASVMFSAIKKVGKLTKKKKKKDKKDKNAEALDSDSESEGEELAEGSGYSGGTLDRSGSETGEIGDSHSENFAQVNFEGDKASVSMCGGDQSEETVPITPTRIRQRRSSAVNMRRQRADRQRAQSLHAVLGNSAAMTGGDDDSSVQGSVATSDTRMRSRRAQSLRGRIQRNKGENGNTEVGSKKSVDVKRAKSLKSRIEASPTKAEKSKKIQRSKSVVVVSPRASKNVAENELPAFDWQAYSAENQKAAPVKKPRDRRKSTKAKELDKRMSGGLSKLIYHQQGVAN